MFNYFKNNIHILLVLLLSLFLKIFYSTTLISWSHDISRDLVTVYKMFVYKEMIWRGPVFSVVWGFLSPIYYYILAPFYYIFNFHPLVPGALTLIINFITLILFYFLILHFFSKKAAVLWSIIYGLSFTVNLNGAYGLNPNFIPPFTFLLLLSLFKLLLEKRPVYLILTFVSSSFIISFHPSGFFIFPALFAVFYFFKYKGLFSYWLPSISSFFVLAILPYALVEKKFDFWNIRQLYKYIFLTPENQEQSSGLIYSLINFIYVLIKNLSLLLFGNFNSWFFTLSSILVVYIIYLTIKNSKVDLKIKLLSIFSVFYLLFFALLIKFEKTNTLAWWFHPVIMPIFLILISVFLSKLKLKFIFSFITIFLVFNIFSFLSYTPSLDTYAVSKGVVDFIRQDSSGANIDIYGSDERPINYMLWYFEKDSELRNKYYNWVKWEKEKNSKVVYLLHNRGSDMDFEDVKQNIFKKHGLNKMELVYTNGESVKVYKLY